jgi:hypothetical protein
MQFFKNLILISNNHSNLVRNRKSLILLISTELNSLSARTFPQNARSSGAHLHRMRKSQGANYPAQTISGADIAVSPSLIYLSVAGDDCAVTEASKRALPS